MYGTGWKCDQCGTMDVTEQWRETMYDNAPIPPSGWVVTSITPVLASVGAMPEVRHFHSLRCAGDYLLERATGIESMPMATVSFPKTDGVDR